MTEILTKQIPLGRSGGNTAVRGNIGGTQRCINKKREKNKE